MGDSSTTVGHRIEGPHVHETAIHVEKKGWLNSEMTRDKIVKGLIKKVTELTTERGVHPGDVAITYDDFDYQQVFGRSLEMYNIYTALDQLAKKLLHKNPERAPLSSCSTEESVLFPHKKTLTNCDCKYFVGPYKQLKGLTVKVVIYLSIQGSSRGHNRLAAYTSLTRSSCLVEMFYIQVKSMRMLNYQTEKCQNMPMDYNYSVLRSSVEEKICQKVSSLYPDDEVLYISPSPTVGLSAPGFPGSTPSAIRSDIGGKSRSSTEGTCTFLIEPEGVETEWVENCLIPKSFYSDPIPGRRSFVCGYEEYCIPLDSKKKIEGSRKTPKYELWTQIDLERLEMERIRRVDCPE